MRLIDADAAMVRYGGNVFDDAPTVDGEHVTHGHWVLDFPLNRCSVCDGYAPCKPENWQPVGFNSKFCPHCGAKLDEPTVTK